MILDEQDVKKLIDILTLAKIVGIENLIIDSLSARGESNDGVFIITDHTIEQFKKTPFGITSNEGSSRVSVLLQRLNIIAEGKKLPKVELEFKERDNGDKIVFRLKIKNNRTTVEFRCADPQMVKAKKILKDALIYDFDLTDETIELMIKSNAAMQTDKIKLILDDGKIYFNINDIEGDSLKHLVTESVTLVDPTKNKFIVTLKHRIVLPLLKLALKENDRLNIKLSEIRNVMTFELNGINIYIMPEV